MTFRRSIGLVLLISTAVAAVTGGIGLYFAVRLIATFESASLDYGPLLEQTDDLATFAERAIALAEMADARSVKGEASLRQEVDSVLANLAFLRSRLKMQDHSGEALRELEDLAYEEKLYGDRIVDLAHATIAEAVAARSLYAAAEKTTAFRTQADEALRDYALGSAATPTLRWQQLSAGREYAWQLLVAESQLNGATSQEEVDKSRQLVPHSMPYVSAPVDRALQFWHQSIAGTDGLADSVARSIEARALVDRLESALHRETAALVRSVKSVASVASVLSGTTRGSFLLNATPYVQVASIAIAIVISLIFGIVIVRRLTRRIDALDRATVALSSGDYSVRVDMSGDDELGRLARSFNKMASDVTELNERLEERVRSRTKALIASREHIREQERQLIQADKMAALGVLVSGVAHEVSNPNQAIRMSTALLARGWPDVLRALDVHFADSPDALIGGLEFVDFRDAASEAIRRVAQSSSRIDAIVASLKDYAAPKATETRAPVNLTVVVKSALTLVENLIKESTDHCAVKLDGNIPTFPGNEQQIEQVVINVIQNACHALPDRRRFITIETVESDDKGSVLLRVADEGVGIPKEDLNRITDPFYTTKRDRGGTGLGLAVTSRIVRDHNGTLSIDSAEGVGTTVTVAFPLEAGQLE